MHSLFPSSDPKIIASGAKLDGRFSKVYLKRIEKDVPKLISAPDGPIIIPKIIHQIWIGSPLPDKFNKMIQSWKDLHPDWEYCLWTDEDVEDFPFVNHAKFMEAKNWGAKADILRYEILEMIGGLYVDIDYECLKAFDQFHHEYEFYTCILNDGAFKNNSADSHSSVTNALIGSIPHHPILKSCVENLKYANVRVTDFNAILVQVGPDYFTKHTYNYLLSTLDPKIAIFKKGFSFPMKSERREAFWKGLIPKEEIERYRNSGAFALHYWATSWQVKQ
jgi:hypothetical protein